jgi:Cytochrome bd terminal oxidase subunit II
VVEFGAVLAAIAAAVLIRAGREGAAFAATSATMAAVVVSLFAELYPRVMVSSLGAANDLTVSGTASSPYALRVMTVTLVVLLPVVLVYQGYTYHVFRSRLTRPGPPDDHGPPPVGAGADTAGAGVDRRAGDGAQQVQAVTWPSRPLAWLALARLAWWLFVWLAAWLAVRLREAVRTPGLIRRG